MEHFGPVAGIIAAKYFPFGDNDPPVIADSHQKCSTGILLSAFDCMVNAQANRMIGINVFFIGFP